MENKETGKGKKKTIVISVIAVVVVLALGIVLWQSPSLQEYLGIKPIDKLNDVRNRNLLSSAQEVLLVNPQAGGDARFRVFDLKMGKNGITPSEIVVNRGDRVQLNFTAVDGKYDLMVKQFGFYFDPVLQGNMSAGSFDAVTAGDFPIACSSFCPLGVKSANLKILQ